MSSSVSPAHSQQLWDAVGTDGHEEPVVGGTPAAEPGTPAPDDPIEALIAECADKTPAEIATIVRLLEAREGVPLADDRARFLGVFKAAVKKITSAAERSAAIENAKDAFKYSVPIMRDEIEDEIREAEADSDDAPALVKDTKPWDEEVDGEEVLDEAREQYDTYMVLDSEWKDTLVLFGLYTHFFGDSKEKLSIGFDTATYLVIESPTLECGKTTCKEILEALVARLFSAGVFTPATVFRTMDEHRPTLFCDESDSIFINSPDMLAIWNLGNRRGAGVPRLVGDDHELHLFNVFGPKVAVLIRKGDNLPPTVASRSIIIPMRRYSKEEKAGVKRWRIKYQILIEPLRRKFARWAEDHREQVFRADEPEFPIEIIEHGSGRTDDLWEPLFKIADVVGGTWPKRIRAAAVGLVGRRRANQEDTGVELLADLREMFRAKQADAVLSSSAVGWLNTRPDRQWIVWKKQKDGITQHQLAALLRPYGIEPRNVRVKGQQGKGYRREDLEAAWSLYLGPEPPVEKEPLK